MRRCSRLVLLSVVATFVGLALSPDARAWARVGHRAAATVTASRLTPAARAAIRDLLEPGETLADASLWADEHRREAPRSGPWHYVNVPISEPRYDPRFCPPTGCVVSKIEELQNLLRYAPAPRAVRQQALRLLVHFVQDLHQPVHVGDRGDRGGNDLQVRFFGQGTNLHRLWDDGIIEHHATDETVWANELDAIAKAEGHSWSGGSVESWADESLAAARKAYSWPGSTATLSPGAALGQDYFDAALPIARRRLAQSAVRLATMLNDLFEPARR